MKLIFSLNQLSLAIKELLPLLKKFHIFTFSGPLGAGKSTLIRELLTHLGIDQTVTSPTFSYVNTYYTKDGCIFHHFDLYRLKSYQEFIDAGFDEYLVASKAFILIEWPEIIQPLLATTAMQKKTCHIILAYHQDDLEKRILLINEQAVN